MSVQAVESGYRTVAQLAEYLGVSVHVVYRNVRTGLWKGSRTSAGPKSPIRFSPAQTAAIEALMERNGERGYESPAPAAGVREVAIDHGMKRLTRLNRR